MNHVKQSGPKTCNIACLQMVGSYYQKTLSESYILSKLPQHSFGNWLPEMALFLEGEGIPTTMYTNSKKLPRNDNENPTLQDTLTDYMNKGRVHIEPFTEKILSEKPAILNVDRSKLYNTGKGKAPHYIVIIKHEDHIFLSDPLMDKPYKTTYQDLYRASLDMNALGNNGLLLVTF